MTTILTNTALHELLVFFICKKKDKETGLTYFGARYFDERSGRFLTPDPVRVVDPFTSKTNHELLANPQRLNRYTYGLNNPYRYIDPDGEVPIPIILAIAAGAWGLDAVSPKSTDVPNSKSFLDHADNATMVAGVGGIRNVAQKAKTSIWSSSKFRSAVQNAFSHYKKHGQEFPNIQNAKQYVNAAKKFLTRPPNGTLSHTRTNGDILRYNPSSNTFGVLRADGDQGLCLNQKRDSNIGNNKLKGLKNDFSMSMLWKFNFCRATFWNF